MTLDDYNSRNVPYIKSLIIPYQKGAIAERLNEVGEGQKQGFVGGRGEGVLTMPRRLRGRGDRTRGQNDNYRATHLGTSTTTEDGRWQKHTRSPASYASSRTGEEPRREEEMSTGRKADDVEVCRSGVMVRSKALGLGKTGV